MTGSYTQNALWKFKMRQCTLPMGTQPDNLLYKGQFLLIWMTLVLSSGHQLHDFNLRLMQDDKEDCKSTPLISPRHRFSVGYRTMRSKTNLKGLSHLKDDTSIGVELIDIICHLTLMLHCRVLWKIILCVSVAVKAEMCVCVCLCVGGGGFKMMMSCLQHR